MQQTAKTEWSVLTNYTRGKPQLFFKKDGGEKDPAWRRCAFKPELPSFWPAKLSMAQQPFIVAHHMPTIQFLSSNNVEKPDLLSRCCTTIHGGPQVLHGWSWEIRCLHFVLQPNPTDPRVVPYHCVAELLFFLPFAGNRTKTRFPPDTWHTDFFL